MKILGEAAGWGGLFPGRWSDWERRSSSVATCCQQLCPRITRRSGWLVSEHGCRNALSFPLTFRSLYFLFHFIQSWLRRIEELTEWRLGVLKGRSRNSHVSVRRSALSWAAFLRQKQKFYTCIMELCTSDFTKTILGGCSVQCYKPTSWLLWGTTCPLSALHELPGVLSVLWTRAWFLLEWSKRPAATALCWDRLNHTALPCYRICRTKGLQCTILPTLMHARCPIKARFANYSPWTRQRRSLWSGKSPPSTRSLDFEAKQGRFIHQNPGKSASREAMEKGPLQKLEGLDTIFTCWTGQCWISDLWWQYFTVNTKIKSLTEFLKPYICNMVWFLQVCTAVIHFAQDLRSAYLVCGCAKVVFWYI